MPREQSDASYLRDMLTASEAWDKIIRQRHVLAHHYGEIEHERIWRVAAHHVPELITQLAALIPSPPPDPEPQNQHD